MLSHPRTQQPGPSSSSSSRPWGAVALLAAAVVGIALMLTITVMGPTSLAGLQLPWLIAFLVLLAAACLWWALFLWLLNRLDGRRWHEGLSRSSFLLALISISLLPDLAVLLNEKLPYSLVFDNGMRSLYLWAVGLLVLSVFLSQELMLVAAVRRKGSFAVVIEGLRGLSGLPGGLRQLAGASLKQACRHPLLVTVLLVGVSMRYADRTQAHPGDMDNLLSMVYTLLSWPPFRYYHDYSPLNSAHAVYSHLPVFPMLTAPFYWLFENVLNLPTSLAPKVVSGAADLATAVLIYSAVKGWWLKNSWGLILAGAFLFAPWVIDANDHATGLAAAFTIAAYASLKRSWLCGILIGLGAATRNESFFLALPLIVHFLARRDLREKVAFLGAFSSTIMVVALPFVLTDPGAVDDALRVQSDHQASHQFSPLAALLLPHLSPGLTSLIRENVSLLAIAATSLASLLAIRDGRVTRTLLVVALVFLLALPVMHPRYIVSAYAAGLFYSARYGNPLVAVVTLVAFLPGNHWSVAVQATLVAVLAAFGLLQIYWPRNVDARAVIGWAGRILPAG